MPVHRCLGVPFVWMTQQWHATDSAPIQFFFHVPWAAVLIIWLAVVPEVALMLLEAIS